ncbi:MAG: LptF/LptG family permease [Planctomycetes bacterium]|nr:LptF/LptG family permease [Planctomycetota bacterium]
MLKLDKYILLGFIVSLSLSILGIVGIYIIIDIFAKISDYNTDNIKSLFNNLAAYYFYKMPLIITQLFPMILLASVMFLLIRISKYNELSAIICAGISVYRALASVFAVTVVLVISFFLIEEFFAPGLTERANKVELKLTGNTLSKKVMAQFDEDNFMYAEKIDVLKNELDEITIGFCDNNHNRTRTIYAPAGKWVKLTSSWLLYGKAGANVTVITNKLSPRGIIMPQKEEFPELSVHISLDPKQLVKITTKNTFATTSQIMSLMKKYPDMRNKPIYTQLQLQLHSRFASIFTVFILLCIGIYYVLQKEMKSFFVGVGLCLMVSIIFFIFQIFFNYFANKYKFYPALAAWLPTIIFGIIAVYMIRKVRT